MKNYILFGILLLALFGCASQQPASNTQQTNGTQSIASGNPVVVLETSKGNIEIELYADKAPMTVNNFLMYVNEHFYDGTVFHRVMDGFMIQGGGF
ncbi:peptidylprolyl isomerase, partial [Candidatus Micrarchaeota archaeon]|nr:peptidylprolyl isomerase [Candidatus Micrarchaeota archaeon]